MRDTRNAAGRDVEAITGDTGLDLMSVPADEATAVRIEDRCPQCGTTNLRLAELRAERDQAGLRWGEHYNAVVDDLRQEVSLLTNQLDHAGRSAADRERTITAARVERDEAQARLKQFGIPLVGEPAETFCQVCQCHNDDPVLHDYRRHGIRPPRPGWQPGQYVRMANGSVWLIKGDRSGTLIAGEWLPGDLDTLHAAGGWELLALADVDIALTAAAGVGVATPPNPDDPWTCSSCGESFVQCAAHCVTNCCNECRQSEAGVHLPAVVTPPDEQRIAREEQAFQHPHAHSGNDPERCDDCGRDARNAIHAGTPPEPRCVHGETGPHLCHSQIINPPPLCPGPGLVTPQPQEGQK